MNLRFMSQRVFSFGVLTLLLAGCGSGINGTAMQGIDEEAKATIASALRDAGIDREPEAIKDLGDRWLVALSGSMTAAAPVETQEPQGEDTGDMREESDTERFRRNKTSLVDPKKVEKVFVSKDGSVSLLN